MDSIRVRRSNLIVPLADAGAIESAWRHDADAITLDLESVEESGKAAARAKVKDAIAPCARGAAEVFVRVSDATLTADLEASVWPGVRGIMLPRAESAADIAEAAETITSLERERGLPVGTLEIVALIESPAAVWNVRHIVTASPRLTQIGLDEVNLAASLGIDADPEYDPFVYARGRLAVEATAAKVGAVGMSYPLSALPREAGEREVHAAATKARNSGMKGVVCRYASWVASVNAAFTPTPELVEWNRRVREAFAKGVAEGTAAVPLDGKMIDVPVDEWAIVVLAMAEACAARDAEKAAARRKHAA